MDKKIEDVATKADTEPLKRDLIGLHKYKPKYVFLTESSAIPVGYALREAWKVVFGTEECPKFFRIDPNQLADTGASSFSGKIAEEYREKVEDFFKKRIKDRKASIFIYDEESVRGGSPGIVCDILKNPSKYGLSEDIKCENVKMVTPQTGVWMHPDEYHAPEVRGASFLPKIRVTNKATQQYDFRGKIKRGNASFDGKSYSPRELVRVYRAIGRRVGEELKIEQQSSNLEKKVTSAIAIGSLAFSILFVSNNLTGNVINDLNQTSSNWIGISLFVIGLICAIFYFKKNK